MLTGPGPDTALASEADCEREPIHIPGSIQPHGVLMVLADEAGFPVLQISDNVDRMLRSSVAHALKQPLETVVGREIAGQLERGLRSAPRQGRPVLVRTIECNGEDGSWPVHAIAHRTDAGIILELEQAPESEEISSVHAHVDSFTLGVEAAESVMEMCQLACQEVQRLTGFDRVLIYQFDDDWNGTVVGEAGTGRLAALLHHRFPAADIPAQARELYRINRLRIIPDASYRPVAIVPAVNPTTKQTPDLTFSVLRSVSPVHLQYMRNMGTAASMSISILKEGRLWGLISCHHVEPRTVPFPLRVTCDLFARAISLRLSAIEHRESLRKRLAVQSAYGALLQGMADRGEISALARHPEELLRLTESTGAAVVSEQHCLLMGTTPDEAQCRELAQWLHDRGERDVYSTHQLPAEFPGASAYATQATGLLAIAISRLHASYLLWFRPEFLESIRWGGDPRKLTSGAGGDRLHPRKSFETWVETVRGRSLPWTDFDREIASELRNAIVDVVLKRAEEMAELNAELRRSNVELESFSYSVSHDLRAPLRHIVGYAEMLRDLSNGTLGETGQRCISSIIESSEYAGKLVDKLLSYSRLGRAQLQYTDIDLTALFHEVVRDVMRDAAGRTIEWTIAPLPTVRADLMMLRMALRDLASNAVKYTRHRDVATIEIGSNAEARADVIWIADNGVGFDMQYSDKLFGVFQRLHRWEDYEGTGIGLANVRRVLERHGGAAWARGEVNRGATFFLKLPRMEPSSKMPPC